MIVVCCSVFEGWLFESWTFLDFLLANPSKSVAIVTDSFGAPVNYLKMC